eukprot:1856474-Karenia_brevis.AAC.1
MKPAHQEQTKLRIGTLNITTLAALGQRQALDKWMRFSSTDILGLQETKQQHNSKEQRRNYTIYYSGQDRLEEQILKKKVNTKFIAGVGAAVSNRLQLYIHRIVPLNDRIMILELNLLLPTFIIIAYAPTAESEDYFKTGFYNMLSDTETSMQEYKQNKMTARKQ